MLAETYAAQKMDSTGSAGSNKPAFARSNAKNLSTRLTLRTRFSSRMPHLSNPLLRRFLNALNFPVDVEDIVLAEGAVDVVQASIFSRFQVQLVARTGSEKKLCNK